MRSYLQTLLPVVALTLIFVFTNYTAVDQHNLTKQNLTDNLDCGLTDDFISFLNQKGYGEFNYNRSDIKCGSYGGRRTSSEKLVKTPIIFIHGNSDVGFGRGTLDGYAEWQTGFRSLAAYFTASGYKKAQLYTTTWGNANPDLAGSTYHSKQNITYLRNFIEAVLTYTNSTKVVVIGHSMGVTLGRKIIKGGLAVDHVGGNYSVGISLHDKVHAFIGIAGANYGLTACYGVSQTQYPTCNKVDGFYPGLLASSAPSTFLNELNIEGGPQGEEIYSIWSKYDNVIGEECIVWGRITCRIPGQTSEIVKTEKQWNHFALRDNTGQDILALLVKKTQ